MAILNRILSVAIFALAIATLVFSVKLYDQRQIIVEQRELLVKALKNVGSQTGYPVTGKFSIDKNGANSISKETIAADENSVIVAVKSLKEHRDALATIITEMGKIAKLDQLTPGVLSTEELQNSDSAIVAKRAKSILDSVAAIIKRDEDIFANIQSWGEILNISVNIASLRSPTEYGKPMEAVQAGIIDLKERTKYLALKMKEAIEKVTSYEWSFSADELDLADYKEALEKLIADMEKVNEKLALITKLEEEIKTLNGNIEGLNNAVTDKDAEIKVLNETIVALRASNKELDEKLKIYTDLNLDTSLIGNVSSVNDKFGFIIFNLGKGQVQIGLEMYIARGTEYIATIKILDVFGDKSIAEISAEYNKGKVEVGDKVIFMENLKK